MGGCFGVGCGGACDGGCRPRVPDVEKPSLLRPKRTKKTTMKGYNRNRLLLGGLKLHKPFKLIRKGMGTSMGLAKAMKALIKGLRFRR